MSQYRGDPNRGDRDPRNQQSRYQQSQNQRNRNQQSRNQQNQYRQDPYRQNQYAYDQYPQRRKKAGKSGAQKVLITLIVIAILLLGLFVMHGITMRNDDTGIESFFSRQDPPERQTEEPTPIPRTEMLTGVEHHNPLTGEPMDLGLAERRPLAIVLNNISDSLPHNGVSSADIIYEYPVEGGLTRMLAIYQDIYGVKLVGSIRSARLYTVQIAESYDAILIGAGRSQQAQAEVNSLGIPFLNEVEGTHRDIFFRDRNRIPGRRVDNLHAVVTTGERVLQWLPEYDFRLTHQTSYEHMLRFIEDGTPDRGSNASEVLARLSTGKSSEFIYDTDDKVYYMRQYSRDFTDANDDSRPAFTNVLILKTSVTNIQGDDVGRLNIVTTGTGEGYFISGGQYIEITWKRNDVHSPFAYTHLNGVPLELGIGKTFICIVPDNLAVDFD